ncbi:baseplate J/gp47 family protein [Apilactobacillus timberlakei]|uniref:baseplate J/gp47 family protein n=1 Tax=Apilactobacillus timberlakei TaxID=2008380 RepID=UPI0015E82C6A|nr:baseplate J/gp47 family protein [Apilactobacillus timberlakei]
MPLTDDGYIDLVYEDVVDKKSAEYKKSLGNVDTSVDSVLGKIIRIQAKGIVEADMHAHDVYDSGFKDTSTGISLDRKASNSGIQRQQAQAAVAKLQITGQPGYVIPENTEFMTEEATVFVNAYDTQIDSNGNAELTAYSDDTADYTNVDANTITVQANPVDEINTVTNNAPASGGADLETDYALRKRIDATNQSKEGPTHDGIKTGMLNVNGVTDAFVVSNDTGQTDDQGNPPWTTHVFVKGGRPEDIAQKLWNIGGSNTSFVGDQAITTYDRSNHPQVIHFDYVNDLPIYVSVNLVGQNIDTDTVTESITDYIDGVGMGNTVVLTKLLVAICQNDNVQDANNLLIGTDQAKLADKNITANQYQNATTDESKITVVVNNG